MMMKKIRGTGTGTGTAAGFVMKTYEMVSEGWTDDFIKWGPSDNTFLVFDPYHFSHRILPSFFKHHNFSSFVRQLNTYGFRKVDPDKWEFANEYFLRGQKHLLPNISRRSNNHRNHGGDDIKSEIKHLKQHQTSLDDDIQSMNRRLDTIERRPNQMITLLRKVVHDPDILPRVITERCLQLSSGVGDDGGGRAKRRRVVSSSSQLLDGEDEEGINSRAVSSSDTDFDEGISLVDTCPTGPGLFGPDGLAPLEVDISTPSFPFSLLGG